MPDTYISTEPEIEVRKAKYAPAPKTKSTARLAFEEKAYVYREMGMKAEMVAVAVRLPNGALETIVNYHEVKDKLDYYMNAYDDEFRLKTNPAIRIEGFMLV
jgi:hypothetical protein